ncbi:CZB domain-containing protein [Hymenobacter taeanensis]|uniref:CZB domain-containing protein n=1 Tax=Hymenobacter taeanensis TaxID=2735321 RepID=A0A6M6BF55_9BACT|nr:MULTISPECIES: CZB domain-containing protein [Hymenobacter]QJX45785.1 CZB domain-containing protein [Hymenobacter taeanensis]UOQ79628.1 CZB domain-containing protein [Hymenobacter sp. 5414T-23]
MNDELKQDFDSALIKHLSFKSKLRSSLYGSSTNQAPIRDPNVCSFGQWVNTRVLKEYAHLPISRELNRVHIQMHQVANRLLDLSQQGQQDEAIAGLAEVDQIADHITQLLRTMQQQLRTGR